MTEPVVTFPGKTFGDLSEEQKLYVSHLMISWRLVSGFWFDRMALKRAIRKARQNKP